MLHATVSKEAISLGSVTKRFDDVIALDGISLTIEQGEFFSVLGPSGCGKTTLLRIIAGLEEPDEGTLRIAGKSMIGVPPQQRPVNTVFQNYALFPHLNVFDNVGFGLKMRRTPRPELAMRVGQALDLTAISELGARLPSQLSGGQRQRVALARALVNAPAVLLLDEPLAAVDAKLRGQLQSDLKSLQRRLATTFIYVTHDQDEALALSDRLAILSRGRVAQCGTPAEIYERPHSRFVASFLGGCNIIEGSVTSVSGGFVQVMTRSGIIVLPDTGSVEFGPIILGIRREKLRLNPAPNLPNVLRGRVIDISYTGPKTEFTIQIGETVLRGWLPNVEGQLPKRDEVAEVQLPPESILILKPE